MREDQLPSAGGGVRPGSMTTAMRAVSPGGASTRLAVRIAIARHGRLEREWVLEKGELTIGRSEKADVTVPGLAFDRAVVLRVTPDGAQLVAPMGARGRLQSGGPLRDLAGGGETVSLDDTARGRVVLGSGEDEVAILFHRVPAPPARVRPALPLAVQQRLFDRVDWRFTAVAAASFMLHFGGIVMLTEADWPMPPGLAEIDDRVAQIVYAVEEPPPDAPSFTDPSTPTDPETPIARTEPTTPSHPSTPRSPSRPSSPSTPSLTDVDTAVDNAVAMLLGGIGNDGSLIDLVRDGAPIAPFGEVMAQVDGVDMASTDPGALRPRDSGHSVPGPISTTLRRGDVDGTPHAEGVPLTEHPVHVAIDQDPDDVPDPMDPTWDVRLLRAAVQRRMSSIQRCYEIELTRSSELAGRVTVSMRVEEIGTLSRVHIEDDTTGSRTLGECVVRQIQSIRLQSGPEGGLVAEYPIVFAPQR